VRLKQYINEFGSGDEDAQQLYSNIDAASRMGLYELWLEQRLHGDSVRLKGGTIDANTEFAMIEGACDFLNSSMGYTLTIVAFPSYPEPKLGFGFFLKPRTNRALNLGVFQTADFGTLSIAEPGRRWQTRGVVNGRVCVGYWRSDGTLPRWDGSKTATSTPLLSNLSGTGRSVVATVSEHCLRFSNPVRQTTWAHSPVTWAAGSCCRRLGREGQRARGPRWDVSF
jgi:hypothetical protein